MHESVPCFHRSSSRVFSILKLSVGKPQEKSDIVLRLNVCIGLVSVQKSFEIDDVELLIRYKTSTSSCYKELRDLLVSLERLNLSVKFRS